jgi:hypothetical protein
MNGSFIIPEKFKQNGKTITVIIDDDYCNEEDIFGEADFTEKIITLCHIYKGKKLTKKTKELTYYHELIHLILDAIGRHNLKWNEDFVEEFAKKLYEYESTKR